VLLSQGVPMVLAGDECGRTQRGNNNAWCQDNEVSWFDWSLVDTRADLVRFVRELIRFRLGNPTLRQRRFMEGGSSASGRLPDVEWFSPEGEHIDWYAADGSLSCFFAAPCRERLLAGPDLAAGGIDGVPRHVLLLAHAGSLPRTFVFPRSAPLRAFPWRVFVDTGRPAPLDIVPDGAREAVDVEELLERPERSLLVLVADVDSGGRIPLTAPVRPSA